MTTIETITHPTFTAKFGSNLTSRMRKLSEEVMELYEAITIYNNATDPADRAHKMIHLLDEIGDVQAVLSHMTNICGSDFQTVLTNAYIKVKIRERDKNYLKSNGNTGIHI